MLELIALQWIFQLIVFVKAVASTDFATRLIGSLSNMFSFVIVGVSDASTAAAIVAATKEESTAAIIIIADIVVSFITRFKHE